MLFEKYDPQTLEPQILEYWQQKRIVEKLRERDKKNKKFYFLNSIFWKARRILPEKFI